MVDFIADTEDLTEFVDQKVVEVINNKEEEEEEVIKEAFFSSKNGHMLHTRQKWISIAEADQLFQDQDCDERLHALAPICYFSTAEVIPLNDTTFLLVLYITLFDRRKKAIVKDYQSHRLNTFSRRDRTRHKKTD